MRDDRERLLDILEAIESIARYTDRGETEFNRDELIQIWVLHHVQIIGEASRGLSEQFRAEHPQIPWTQIIGMRNILVHHYFGIDKAAVWAVTQHDLPDLKQKVQITLDESGNPEA